jgi:hypothetical protein
MFRAQSSPVLNLKINIRCLIMSWNAEKRGKSI